MQEKILYQQLIEIFDAVDVVFLECCYLDPAQASFANHPRRDHGSVYRCLNTFNHSSSL